MSPFSFARHPRADLSALADGQLPPSRSEQVQRHADSCAQCRDELAGILATREALAELPEIPSPRSFTLTAERVASPARVYEHAPARRGLVNGLRLGSAGLAMALAIVVFIDAGPGGNSENLDTSGSDEVALEMTPSTEEYQSSGDAAEGENLFAPSATEAPTPVPPISDSDAGTGGSGQGSGGGTGGGGVGSTGGGSGIAATDTTSPAAAPATPLPTATATGAPGEAVRASDDSATQEDKAGSDGAEAPDSTDDMEAAESASKNDGNGGLLALEVLLAMGALGALVVSVWVARASRNQPTGN